MADIGHVFRQIGFFGTYTTRHCGEHSDQDIKKNPTSGLGEDEITSLSMGNFTKSGPGTKRPNLSKDRIFFFFFFFSVLAQQGIVGNILTKI